MTAEPLITGRAHPNKRQLSKAATVEKMKAAAAFLFANQGYFSVGIRDVARRMGMSTGSVMANIETKDDLWRLAMGAPAPDVALAEEVALLEAHRPGWRWSLSNVGAGYVAHVSCGAALVEHGAVSATGKAASPALALREARIQADRLAPRDPLRLSPSQRRS